MMIKYLNRISTWTLLVGAVFLGVHAKSNRPIDYRDEFSFSFAQAGADEIYYKISETQLSRFLEQRLDLFPKAQLQKLARHLLSVTYSHGLNPVLVLAMIEAESGFRVKVVSSAGAIGLMQLMPDTARVVAKRFGIKYTGPKALSDPFTNLSLGIAYLAQLRDKYQGLSPYYAIAAYNMGPARLDQLMARPGGFRPAKTKEYYDQIVSSIAQFKNNGLLIPNV